jgi:uncharacterized protein YraI
VIENFFSGFLMFQCFLIYPRSSKMKAMRKLALFLILLALLTAACGTPQPVPTSLPTLSPSALPTETQTPTITPLQPTLTATLTLVDGTLTSKVNVRSGPGTGYGSLGQLDNGGKVQITAQDGSGTWYQILYPAAPLGRAWVIALYVTVSQGSQIPLEATPTPTGPTGRVIQRLNVRSGPATSFDSLGLLEPDALVFLTGKNSTASWFQVEYPAGPGGKGWVTSQYIQTDFSANVPVLDDYGVVVLADTTGTPSGSFLSPTPTVGPAYLDGDSSTNPAVHISFSSSGTHQFSYSSQVSSPEGDPVDWVEFTPYTASGTNAHLVISLVCTGNGTLTVEMWQGNSPLSGWGSLACGGMGTSILLRTGQAYLIRLAPAAGAGLRLVAYTLTVQNNP